MSAVALLDHEGRVLVARRPIGKSHARRWEFPGGKIMPGETASAAAARELKEELGVAISEERLEFAMNVQHVYDTQEVELSFFICREFAGTSQSLEGQDLLWIEPTKLSSLDLLEANRSFVRFVTMTAEHQDKD